MTKDELLQDDTRWVHALNVLRDKHVPERDIAKVTLPVIKQWQDEILNRKFKWEIPYMVKIPKKAGGFRECLALPFKSRIVMNVISGIYYDLFEGAMSPRVYSYKEEVSVAKAVHNVKRYSQTHPLVGYKVDLSKYFDSVEIEYLEDLLFQLDSGSVVDELVWDFYHDTRLQTKDGVVEHYRSLCQGVAMSAVLANLFLVDVDIELSDIVGYWRYSDDILLIGDRSDEAFEMLSAMLDELGLELNPKKIERVNGEVTFLGVTIGEKLNIAKENMRALKLEGKRRCAKQKPTRRGQACAVRQIQRFLFHEDFYDHSAFKYYASLKTSIRDFRELNNYYEAQIRAVYTGKQNYTSNRNKTPDSVLYQELGWVPLTDLLRWYYEEPELYEQFVRRVS